MMPAGATNPQRSTSQACTSFNSSSGASSLTRLRQHASKTPSTAENYIYPTQSACSIPIFDAAPPPNATMLPYHTYIPGTGRNRSSNIPLRKSAVLSPQPARHRGPKHGRELSTAAGTRAIRGVLRKKSSSRREMWIRTKAMLYWDFLTMHDMR